MSARSRKKKIAAQIRRNPEHLHNLPRNSSAGSVKKTAPIPRWHFLEFKHSHRSVIKNHVVPISLSSGIVEDLVSRYDESKLKSAVPTTTAHVDFGGMIITTTPEELFEVDGLTVSVWCDQLEEFLLCLRQLIEDGPRRTPFGKTFHKIHGHWHCIVLEEEQTYKLVDEIKKRLPVAEKKMEEFHRSRERENKPKDMAAVRKEMVDKGFMAPVRPVRSRS